MRNRKVCTVYNVSYFNFETDVWLGFCLLLLLHTAALFALFLKGTYSSPLQGTQEWEFFGSVSCTNQTYIYQRIRLWSDLDFFSDSPRCSKFNPCTLPLWHEWSKFSQIAAISSSYFNIKLIHCLLTQLTWGLTAWWLTQCRVLLQVDSIDVESCLALDKMSQREVKLEN
jgi:hypothetical protein